MKKRTVAITAFKKFELSNPTKVLGGAEPPIIDKKKTRVPKQRR